MQPPRGVACPQAETLVAAQRTAGPTSEKFPAPEAISTGSASTLAKIAAGPLRAEAHGVGTRSGSNAHTNSHVAYPGEGKNIVFFLCSKAGVEAVRDHTKRRPSSSKLPCPLSLGGMCKSFVLLGLRAIARLNHEAPKGRAAGVVTPPDCLYQKRLVMPPRRRSPPGESNRLPMPRQRSRQGSAWVGGATWPA